MVVGNEGHRVLRSTRELQARRKSGAYSAIHSRQVRFGKFSRIFCVMLGGTFDSNGNRNNVRFDFT